MTPELKEKLAGRRIIASISGGKDSAALSLYLTEQGIEHERVFMDTGWEHAWTYEYIQGPLTRALGPIKTISAAKQMEDLIVAKAMFPSRKIRFCTDELKVFPMRDYIAALQDAGDEVVNVVGIRREESASRSTAAEWEFNPVFDCDVWRPLVDWTEQQVIGIHAKHALKPNPLYLKGALRVGCWPCIFSNKSEIANISKIDPARIDRIRNLESTIAVKAKARWDRDRAKWESDPASRPAEGSEAYKKLHRRLFEFPFQPPTFFQSNTPDQHGRYPMLGIDEVVKWSNTSRGGKQFEMFASAGRDQGCMRWGLCDTGVSREE